MKHFLYAAFPAIMLIAGPVAASPSAPSLKPALNFTSKVVDKSEYERISKALDAADAGRWFEVRQAIPRIRDEDASRLLRWRIATNAASNASFSELNSALEDLQDWPKYSIIRSEAERAMSGASLSNQNKSAWLKKYPPLTGEGKLELANVLRSEGELKKSDALLREIWRSHSLSKSSTETILSNHGRLFSAEDHAERVEMLLWTGQRSEARRLLPRLPSAMRQLPEARLAMMERRSGVDAAIEAVPAKYQDDPGLLFDRAQWRRKRARNEEGAIELLLKINAEDALPVGRAKIWRERRIVLRTLIKERRWKEAYAIASDHHLTEGVNFAEAEFYSGWVALRHLKDPATALAHFDSLANGVSSPISVSRGQYWKGAALDALGRQDEALAAYTAAAVHNFTFYGQLAAEKLHASGRSNGEIFLQPPRPATEQERLAFESRPVVRAAKLQAETGRLRSFERFSFHLDDMLDNAHDHQMLFDMAMEYLEPRSGIRGAKSGLAKGLIAPEAAFPIVALPPSPRSGVAEEALVIALSRQESELTPTAVSRANARGMMQIIPATARNTARQTGMPYRTSWLTDDPNYNMRLGRSYLDGLIEQFNGSYILALAGYNAGPSRSRQWIADYGDPRSPDVDAIDWIESIPFSETRNYVQRISENLQVYRSRLSRAPTQIRLSEDIKRGYPD